MEQMERPWVEILREVCEARGYGWVMQRAEWLWAEKSKRTGFPGMEHTCGPCRASLDRAGLRSNLELLHAWETLPEDVRERALAAVRTKPAGEPR